jgi:hypothetical protein
LLVIKASELAELKAMEAADPAQWDELWGSVHEAAHAVAARHFGLRVEIATMRRVRIPHPAYTSFDDQNSLNRLIVSAAGDAATSALLGWTDTGKDDDAGQRFRLRDLGADDATTRRLMRTARLEAEELVRLKRAKILAVAKALRAKKRLDEAEIDAESLNAGRINHR